MTCIEIETDGKNEQHVGVLKALFNFSGLAGLERDKDAITGGEAKVLSGAEAFALAHESLVKILGEM